MATAPYGVRLLVGAATFAVEETLKLPRTILMYPMTLASQAAHAVMVWQQSLAELAVKGDSTLEQLFPPKDEQPEWATFDEDVDGAGELEFEHDAVVDDAGRDRQAEGRFALYSLGADDAPPDRPAETDVTPGRHATSDAAGSAPQVVTELDYPTLTLAQLRARLHSLNVDELEALLTYEEATRARAPFQTLLANRITRATAK